MSEIKERIEIIEITENIIIVGVSLQKSGLPITFDSLGKMWEIFGASYRGQHKITNESNTKLEYAVLLNKVPDYIAGHAVSSADEIPEDCSSVIIPKGRYIKDTFSAETFETLTNNILPKRNIKAWAKNNKIKIEGLFSVEVYPWENFENGNFEMYTLTPIKG